MNPVCIASDCWHSECAWITSCSCYFLLAQAQLISDSGNQEKNWIPLMETYFLGNATLPTNPAISQLTCSHSACIFTKHPGPAEWWQSHLANIGQPLLLVQNSQASIVEPHDAWIGRDKKLSLTSFSFSDEWPGGQQKHFIQGHRLVGRAWDFPFWG